MKQIILGIFIYSTIIFAGQKVYIVPKGKVYHSTRQCSTLSRSKTIHEVDISEVGSRKHCKKC